VKKVIPSQRTRVVGVRTKAVASPSSSPVSSCLFPHVLARSFCCCFHRLLPFLPSAVLVGSNPAIAVVSTTTVSEHHCEHSTQETNGEREREREFCCCFLSVFFKGNHCKSFSVQEALHTTSVGVRKRRS